MRKLLLGLIGISALALPQIAAAQEFSASEQNVVKFLCGDAPGGDSRLGVVGGHYNTVVNVQALKDRSIVAFRATAISGNFEMELGVPSEFSSSETFDRDGAGGIFCRDIKNVLGVGGDQGFVEGFVSVYSNKPVIVESVLTGEGDQNVSVMQVVRALRWATSLKVRPPIPE